MQNARALLGSTTVVSVLLLAMGCTESRLSQSSSPMTMTAGIGGGSAANGGGGGAMTTTAGIGGGNGGSGGAMTTKPMMMPPQSISDAGPPEQRDGNFKPPFDPRDATVPDSSRPDAGQCTDGTQRCVLPNGGAGICSESGTCGGCQDTNECIRVYGEPYYMCATGENCFIPA